MIIGLQCRVPFLGILDQQLGKEILGLVAALVEGLPIQSIDSLLDAVKNRLNIFAVEGGLPTQQDVQNDSAGPE